MPAPFAYLATPYSLYPLGIERAFTDAANLAARLIKTGLIIYSPIAHTHPIAIHGVIDPFHHTMWLRIDEAMMHAANTLIIAHMLGWQNSKGIAHEIAYFETLHKPIFDLDVDTLNMVRRC